MSDLQKITEQQMDAVGVCSAPDMLTGSASENKAVFDKMIRQLIAPAYNAAVDAINTINQTETGIEAAEESRVLAEQARVEAEKQREAAEQKREAAETGYVAQAASSAAAAAGCAAAAAGSAGDAAGSAALSQSWAAGDTGTRPGEDTDNARYWAAKAQAEADRATVPAAEGAYNVIMVDRTTGDPYALMVEDGVLKLLGMKAGSYDPTQVMLVDGMTGIPYTLTVESGTLKMEEC